MQTDSFVEFQILVVLLQTGKVRLAQIETIITHILHPDDSDQTLKSSKPSSIQYKAKHENNNRSRMNLQTSKFIIEN